MNFLKSIFKKKENIIKTDIDFWNWFQKNEQTFFEVVKKGENMERDFFDELSPKLSAIKDGIYFLTGMFDANTAELILTTDGVIKNIAFVEDLVKSAPVMPNWKFTALKPNHGKDSTRIEMKPYTFDSETMFFYPIEHKNYPDEIEIEIVHINYSEENKSMITSGTYIFLDNYLGELKSVTIIDRVTVIPKEQAKQDLISIDKLYDYLVWREKEFVEKYEGKRHDTENDTYSSFEAELNNGKPLFAVINTTLLEWDSKASHPWILEMAIKYDGDNNNGMPDNETYQLLNVFEDEIMLELKDSDGYLNIGRQTADNERVVYFACQDFRKPCKVVDELKTKYNSRIELTYDIYKDKYWRSFERFSTV
ncbi:MAG TPA: DUF695 domain-containing protein [Flavobacterium sp.]|nr:DUF695 domain-containing protein [Flavobacterium sp.]